MGTLILYYNMEYSKNIFITEIIMKNITNHLITKQKIRHIVQQVLTNKQKLKQKIKDKNQICQQLLRKKKLTTQNRLQAMKKKLKIFNNLDTYIDFQSIYWQIVNKIRDTYIEMKRYQNNVCIQTQQQFTLQNQLSKTQYKSVYDISQKIYEKVQIQYGKKLKQILKSHSDNIADLLNKCKIQQHFNQINNNYQSQYLNKFNEDHKFHKIFKEFPNMSNISGLRKTGTEKFVIKKLVFTQKQKQQLNQLYRIGLTFLEIAIERSRNRSNFGNNQGSKIKRLANSGFGFRFSQGCQTYNRASTVKQNIRPDVSFRRTADTESDNIQSPHHNERLKLRKTLNDDQVYRNLRFSVRPVKKQSKTGHSSLNKNKMQEVSSKITQNINQINPHQNVFPVRKSNLQSIEKNDKCSNKLKKVNIKSYKEDKQNLTNISHKMSKIIDQIQRQQYENKKKTPVFHQYLTQTMKQFESCTKLDQFNITIKEIKNQIVQMNFNKTYTISNKFITTK